MKTAKQIITGARERIADTARWTQCNYALTAGGVAVEPEAPDACRWCSKGALHAEMEDALDAVEVAQIDAQSDQNYTALDLVQSAVERLYPKKASIIGVNDHLGHAAALRVFDAAIEAAP